MSVLGQNGSADAPADPPRLAADTSRQREAGVSPQLGKTQLYRWTISPGDGLPAYYFSSGIVRATAQEIDAIRRDIDPRHPWVLSIDPLDDEVLTLNELRQAIGGGLATYHGEVAGSQPCEGDWVYIKAYERP